MINLNTFRPINFTRLKGVLPFGEVMDRARKHWIPKGSGLRVVMRVLRFALLHTPFAAAQFFEGSSVYPPLFIHLWGFHTPLMCRCPAPFCNTHSVDDDDGQMTMRCKPTTECQIESAQPHYNNCRLKIAIYLARKVRGRPRMSNACHKMAKILPQAETDIRWCGWTDPFRGVLTGGVGHGHWDVTRLGEVSFPVIVMAAP